MPDPAAQPEPASEPEAAPEPVASSGALDDAAPESSPDPLPDAAEEDSIPTQAPVTGLRLVPALEPEYEPEPEPAGPVLTAVPDLEPDEELKLVQDFEPDEEPEPVEEFEPDTAPELEPDEAPADATASEPEPEAAIFVPERPRRELLTLDKPVPPRGPTTGRDEMMPRIEDDESLDIVGSPRGELRAAGLAVPKMHQLVRRGDTAMWAFVVRPSEALGWWLDIRQSAEQTGWMPVLLGAAEEWRDNGEAIIHEGDDELTRADEIDPAELLHDKAAEAGEPARGVPILPRRGDTDFATPHEAHGLLGLVRTDAGWKIPAMFPWKGSTNWELYGAEHAAVLHSWHRRFEAELVAMTYDVIELYVPHPPRAEEALAVAGEVYAYCPDLLDSGVPTLEDLAEHMIRSKAWYFHWS
ncbi:DUF4253 domain-containing protein [Glycomyces tritici]|uniref:DUF4253 domain-containing protein n=1 Tax=Glycomyces tritici TaxID=2665176 RepID=A0ABT7YQ91_9ACTN|nr:DUF4253 domain-containing protein [Glycomyces tritici]MDN3240816.1 DUF4253 domain-containing protein [Glycomyces tritici]